MGFKNTYIIIANYMFKEMLNIILVQPKSKRNISD